MGTAQSTLALPSQLSSNHYQRRSARHKRTNFCNYFPMTQNISADLQELFYGKGGMQSRSWGVQLPYSTPADTDPSNCICFPFVISARLILHHGRNECNRLHCLPGQ